MTSTGSTAGALAPCSALTSSTTLSFIEWAWSATGFATTSLFDLTSAILSWSIASSKSESAISKLQQPNVYHDLLSAMIFGFLSELNLMLVHLNFFNLGTSSSSSSFSLPFSHDSGLVVPKPYTHRRKGSVGLDPNNSPAFTMQRNLPMVIVLNTTLLVILI